jgi:hypothetical protein
LPVASDIGSVPTIGEREEQVEEAAEAKTDAIEEKLEETQEEVEDASLAPSDLAATTSLDASGVTGEVMEVNGETPLPGQPSPETTNDGFAILKAAVDAASDANSDVKLKGKINVT